MAVQIGDSHTHLTRDGLAVVNGAWYIVLAELVYNYDGYGYYDYYHGHDYRDYRYGKRPDSTTTRVYKATNPVTTWAEQDAGHEPNLTPYYIRGALAGQYSVFPTSTQLHIRSETQSYRIYGGTGYSLYDCTTDAWLVNENADLGSVYFGAGGDIAVRSNGDVLVTRDLLGPAVFRRTGPGAWTQVANFANYGRNWYGYYEGPSTRTVLGASDRLHAFYDNYDNGGLLGHSMDAANALDAEGIIDAAAQNVPTQSFYWNDDAYYQGAAKTAHSWTDGAGTVRVGALYQDSRFGAPPPVGLSYAFATSVANPTWTHATVSTEGAPVTEPAIAVDNFVVGRVDALHVLWIRDRDSAIMHSTSTNKGASWVTDAAPVVVGQAPTRVLATAYTRAGYVYVGYAYENSYGVFYDELQVRRLPTGSALSLMM